MKQISALREEVEGWQALRQRIHDALDLTSLEDEGLRDELTTEIETVEAEVSRREFYAMFSGKHDHGDALLASMLELGAPTPRIGQIAAHVPALG
jgi:hypothetical protein